ncbi:hypothetical protein MKW98_001106, partial [Papaver atlanticum]
GFCCIDYQGSKCNLLVCYGKLRGTQIKNKSLTEELINLASIWEMFADNFPNCSSYMSLIYQKISI